MCVRHVIPLVRMAEEYYVLKRGKNDSGQEPTLLLIFDTGYYTIVTGWGKLFDIYCRRKQLGDYTVEM